MLGGRVAKKKKKKKNQTLGLRVSSLTALLSSVCPGVVLSAPPGVTSRRPPPRHLLCTPFYSLPEPEPGAGQVMEEAGVLGGKVIHVGDSQLKKPQS